uniref:Potassium channel domain-containing protein n=1 Tax=Leptocylindrus danicus TaxID=163516 RepID=A0A7S2K8U5_9STRA|mmetsp:Transcript_19928/g.29652  ORF Transcript_19928/g.29652 Transcript_19928/m.29652 type:complete len:454 (+) Transcript_19928:106-1467(+)
MQAAPVAINSTDHSTEAQLLHRRNDDMTEKQDDEELGIDMSEEIERREHSSEQSNEMVSRLFNSVNKLDMRRLFVLFLVSYILWCTFFAVVLMLLSYIEPTCISPYEVGADEDNITFHDAFILSWTTFSTVGYGNVSPQVESGIPNKVNDCIIVGIVISLEAFIGILFAGFSGAILFTKLVSMQSIAHVEFSEPICVELGSGGPSKEKPCPVVTFKIVNMLGNTKGGEIVDASLSCFVITRHYNRKSRRSLANVAAGIDVSSNGENRFSLGSGGRSSSIRGTLRGFSMKSGSTTSEGGGPESVTVIQRTFDKANLRTDTHPFFELDWKVKHDLDETSPLLPRWLREEIKDNDGIWPSHHYNKETIRSALTKFGKLILSIGGTSQSSGASVSGRRVYLYEDIIIGWHFNETLEEREDGKGLRVDFSALNCINECFEGSGEAIEDYRDKRKDKTA